MNCECTFIVIHESVMALPVFFAAVFASWAAVCASAGLANATNAIGRIGNARTFNIRRDRPVELMSLLLSMMTTPLMATSGVATHSAALQE